MTADLNLLAARASSGDRAAFRAIVRHTRDHLFRMTARMTGNTTDAEDVLQDAYIKAHRALARGGFDGRSDVGTWLYRIAANAALDSLRRLRRNPEEPSSHEPGRFDSPVTQDQRLALSDLERLMEQLTPDQRAALVLKAVEGRTTREVAAILERSEGAVEQLLVRARAVLREKAETDDRA